VKSLYKDTKVSQVITPTAGAAGTADINGSTVDMSGFEGVMFIVTFGAITAGAVTSLKAQQGAASDMSDAADLENTGITITDTDDEKVKILEVYRPLERYVRVVVDRGTQNAVVASAIAVQYAPRVAPTSHGTNVAGEAHVSPSEGTA
jgi:hypothetical protein